jgi:hypothetical protein
LLVGAADTGVFKIVAPGPPPAAPLPVPRLVCRDAGDGLASTFIDSDAPLAVACDDAPHDPYNRWTLTTRAATRSRPR